MVLPLADGPGAGPGGPAVWPPGPSQYRLPSTFKPVPVAQGQGWARLSHFLVRSDGISSSPPQRNPTPEAEVQSF